jgi:hypothetical protein
MPQHEFFVDGLHKTKKQHTSSTIKDIESPARHQRQPSPRETKTDSSLCVISNPISRRQRKHGYGRRCCSINDILYTIVFVLIFIWVILQHLLAQSFRNTTHISTDSSIPNVMEHRQQQSQTMIPWIDQIWSGVSSLFSAAPRVTNISSSTASSSQRMEEDYSFIFMLLLGINIATMLPSMLKHIGTNMRKERQLGSTITEEDEQASRHKRLLQTYLPAYLLATSADWLQGPYKYALYSSYGYTQRDIALLFVAGYGSG